jgi:DNA-directed RNA polymerase specialized sigma24 family protein
MFAQPTFLSAWKQLTHLREHSKLRAWLCGIARFVIGTELRRQRREPVHGAEPLEAAAVCDAAEDG